MEVTHHVEATLSPEEEQQLKEVVCEYRDVFAMMGEPLGHTDLK